MQAIEQLTTSLEAEAAYYGGGAAVLTPITQRAERLLKIPAAEATPVAMATAVAKLHNVAGWAAFDSHQDDTARYHFARAMSLGNEGDGYQFARAAYFAGVATAEPGHWGVQRAFADEKLEPTVRVEQRRLALQSRCG